MSDPHPPPNDRWESYTDPLKLDLAQFDKLVQNRGDASNAPEGVNRRSWRRLRVAGRLWVPAEMLGPTGIIVQTRVYPIDIAVGGMAFFTGMFIHEGTACSLTLLMADGERLSVRGTCVRCVFIKGRVHEVGLQFSENFDMSLVMPAGAPADLRPPPETEGGPRATPITSQPARLTTGVLATQHARASHPGATGGAGQEWAAPADFIEIRSISNELVVVATKLAGRLQEIDAGHSTPATNT